MSTRRVDLFIHRARTPLSPLRVRDAEATSFRPAREMTRHEILAELGDAKSAYNFPGGKVRYDALRQVLAEKAMRGEDACGCAACKDRA